jgi:hypothetical protein
MHQLNSHRFEELKPIVKPHKRVKGYWKRYHNATSTDKQEYAICVNVCKQLGNPWQWSNRGRPPKTEPCTYAAVHVYRRHTGKSYRDVERISDNLFGFFIDHSWVGKTLKRVPPLYFIRAVQAIHAKISALVAKHTETAHIVDSTGITADMKTVSDKGKVYMLFLKLHIIIEYWTSLGLLAIRYCIATSNRTSDPAGFRIMIPHITGEGNFYGDSAYEGKQNRKAARKQGFKPHFKPRAELTTKQQDALQFDKEGYKQIRGRVECVFGGTETKHGNKTRCRLETTRQNDTILIALSHNLQALKQVLVIKIAYLGDNLCLYQAGK